jgi:transposase
MSSLCGTDAGFDVHKKFLVAVILNPENPSHRVSTRRFGTTGYALGQLEAYLREFKVTRVAMESTAQYWRPVWDRLEGKFELFLAQTRSTQAPRGRKSDDADALRIARRLVAGDLTLSYVPPQPQRECRLLTRHSVALKEQISRCRNEIEVVLEQAHLKLTSVVSDALGVSGRKILRALLAGETDPVQLASLGHRKLKASREELAEALSGQMTPAQKLVLRMTLDRIEQLEKDIEAIEQELLVQQAEQAEPLKRLCAIPGVSLCAAQQLIAEVGPSAPASSAR